MSKYSSICTAINLIEVISRMMAENGSGAGKTAEVIADLQDIAKDVRYGGQWDGDFETIAAALGYCSNLGRECNICPYREKRDEGCIKIVKSDAAAAIRQLSKLLHQAEDKLKQMEAREPAGWQQAIMKEDGTQPVPPDRFPWDEDEPEIAPAEDGGVL